MSPAKGQRKRFCVNGHDVLVVGRAPNGWCKECREESYARRGLKPNQCPDPTNIKFRNPICKNLHDKRVVGVNGSYRCLQCEREGRDPERARRQRWQRKSREARLPEGMIVNRTTPLPKLRELRLRAGISQREMAARIGCSEQHLNRLENGRRGAGRAMLKNVLDAISETSEGLPRGRYLKLLKALVEAERRNVPTAGVVAEILSESPLKVGALLRWAAKEGLAERFDGPPPGAPRTHTATWLITDEGLALIEGRAA